MLDKNRLLEKLRAIFAVEILKEDGWSREAMLNPPQQAPINDIDDDFVGPPYVRQLELWELIPVFIGSDPACDCKEMFKDPMAPNPYIFGRPTPLRIDDIRFEEIRELFSNKIIQNFVIKKICETIKPANNMDINDAWIDAWLDRDPALEANDPGVFDDGVWDLLGRTTQEGCAAQCINAIASMFDEIENGLVMVNDLEADVHPIPELSPTGFNQEDSYFGAKTEAELYIWKGIIKCIRKKLAERPTVA